MSVIKGKYLLLVGMVPILAMLVWAASQKWRAPNPVVVPQDTAIQVSLNSALASDENRPGDRFDATVTQPVMVGNKTIIPQGAEVEGLVVDAKRSGRIMGRARMRLALESVEVSGKKYEIRTNSKTRVGGNHKNRNIGFMGGGAAAGLLVGAVAAGGKGALIGAPIGAGAGTATAFFTGKKDIRLPAETVLTFKLAEPVTISRKLST